MQSLSCNSTILAKVPGKRAEREAGTWTLAKHDKHKYQFITLQNNLLSGHGAIWASLKA